MVVGVNDIYKIKLLAQHDTSTTACRLIFGISQMCKCRVQHHAAKKSKQNYNPVRPQPPCQQSCSTNARDAHTPALSSRVAPLFCHPTEME